MLPPCDCSICKRGRAIAAAENKMDSPNTRSRSKRALEEDTGSGLDWKHDQDLRRAALKSSESEPIELPAPTQKPRPAVSSLAVSPSQIASSASYRSGEPNTLGTLGPRRKRCRTTRLTINGDVQISRVASSAPIASGSGSGKGLKALLDQMSGVQLGQAQVEDMGPGATAPSATLTNPNISPSQSGVLSPRSLNVQTTDKSPLGNCPPTKLTFGRRPTETVPSSRKTITTHAPLARQTSSRSSITSNTPNTPRSPIARNTGPTPRIGLRTTVKPTQPIPPRLQQAFKPPLMDQPIRSSPRRLPHSTVPPSSSPHSASNRKSTRTLALHADPGPNSSPKMPSSDGAGDDSFDWDQALQNPDLVGMVDGK